MILSDLLSNGKKALDDAGCENAAFDALCLLENTTGYSKTQLFLYKATEVESNKEREFLNLIERRCKREPLQYILGKWEFMGLEFFVGPGVLIPRRETEALAEAAIREVRNKKDAVIFDLCAGTGCVGISIAKTCPKSKVVLLEKSEEALYYLNQNIQEKKLRNITAIQGDVFNGFLSFHLPEPDIIVSNPPYIPVTEIQLLQKEVLFEPVEALNGGEDGLVFYRAINNHWFPYLKKDGMLAVEGGDCQAEDILAIFSEPVKEKYCLLDGNNIKRIIIIKK